MSGPDADVRPTGAAGTDTEVSVSGTDKGVSASPVPRTKRLRSRGASGATPVATANSASPATAVRDPWAESDSCEGDPACASEGDPAGDPASDPEGGTDPARPDGPGATHDPHEVTIQLDGVSLQRDTVLSAAKDAPGGGESSDGPVFVDESGRRSRRFRRIGMAVALACAVYAVVIVATVLSGNSDAPWLPVERPEEKPAGQVDTPPLPAESAPQESTGTGDVLPGTSPTATADATPSTGPAASTPDAAADAEEPGRSTAPKPSATKNTQGPGTDPTPDPDPPAEPGTPRPEPTPTDGGGPTETPTDTPTTEEPAGGTVANGPSDPTPVAQEPADTASSPAAPSPEYVL
ncbi:hypothetical protein ACHBTE_16430 [Streptomyces sp. M41]|uniref:hypothetical protein n=1 Tax=Streptomyces sp. M41 TaxID=3059412 RepID=UPI00374DEFC1